MLNDNCEDRPGVCANLQNAECDGTKCSCAFGFYKTGTSTCSRKGNVLQQCSVFVRWLYFELFNYMYLQYLFSVMIANSLYIKWWYYFDFSCGYNEY